MLSCAFRCSLFSFVGGTRHFDPEYSGLTRQLLHNLTQAWNDADFEVNVRWVVCAFSCFPSCLLSKPLANPQVSLRFLACLLPALPACLPACLLTGVCLSLLCACSLWWAVCPTIRHISGGPSFAWRHTGGAGQPVCASWRRTTVCRAAGHQMLQLFGVLTSKAGGLPLNSSYEDFSVFLPAGMDGVRHGWGEERMGQRTGCWYLLLSQYERTMRGGSLCVQCVCRPLRLWP